MLGGAGMGAERWREDGENEMDVTRENVGEVLQRLYDSEIHLWLGWFWDGGVEYALSPRRGDGAAWEHTGGRDIVAAVQQIANAAVGRYPDSEFARWFVPDAASFDAGAGREEGAP